MNDRDRKSSFSEWLREPQTMIGLAAILLSLCGLFVSFYEASLMRENQQASVWPHVQIGPSISFKNSSKSLKIFTQNTGVGPAKIEAAKLLYMGKKIENWRNLVNKLGGNYNNLSPSFSLINGRVLPANSKRQMIYSLSADSTKKKGQQTIKKFYSQILSGEINVSLCYCSVFEKCWITSLKKTLQKFKNTDKKVKVVQNVESCDESELSGI